MLTQGFDDELKAKECAERQEELDAIAAYGNRAEFLSKSGTYVAEFPQAPAAAAEVTEAHD